MSGNIEKYTKQGKTFYKFKVYTGINPKTGKKSQTTRSGFTTKAAATAERRKIQAKVANGSYWDIDNITAPQTVGDLFDEFIKLKSQSIRSSTLRNYKHAKNHFKDILNVKLDKLSTNDVLNIVEKSKPLLSTPVLNHYLATIKAAFKYALNQGYIKRNLLAQIPRIYSDETKSKKLKVYTKEQLEDFLQKIKDYNFKFYVLSRVIAMSGMRIGEVCALSWDDVDFENNTLTVSKTITRNGSTEVVGAPKTKASFRTIPVDKETMNVLSLWKHENPGSVNVFQGNTSAGCYETRAFRDGLKRFYDKHPELPRLKPHDLRHTHASLLFANNVNPKVIQQRLGHESIEITLDVYVHLYEDNDGTDEIINVLNNIKG